MLVGPLVEGWPYPYSPRALLELRGAVLTALSAARPVAERFREPRTQGWFAGFAAHSMLPLERRPSAGFALALLTLGHAVGWPFPRGGSQRLADALAARLLELGGEIHVSSPVDELPDADTDTLIASGFCRLGPWDDEPADVNEDRFDQLDDMASTTSLVFLGLTLGCARCHNHKFEPLTMHDYYRMVAVFDPLKRPQLGRTLHDRRRPEHTVDTPMAA